MPMFTRSRAHPVATTTTARKPSLLSRLTASTRKPRTTTATTTRKPLVSRRRAAPVHHKRKPTIGDRISGALMRIKGKFTGRSGVMGAGTKRMRGTDGRGARTRRARRPLI